MFEKNLLIDFINYGIIASIFLVIPYTTIAFLSIIILLIIDLIKLYIIEKKEAIDSYDLEEDYRYDHWEG